MKPPKSKSHSAKETRRILETTQHKINDELSRACLCQACGLDTGGSLVLFENEKGQLYESTDELRALISHGELQARKRPTNIASELLPQGHALKYGKSASLRGWVAGTLGTWHHRKPRPYRDDLRARD